MKDLTKGHPLKLIIIFAIPLIIGQLFQQFYSIVDTRIVGVTLGEDALAAVGSTSTLSDLMISFMNGSAAGFSIITANFFGAKDDARLKKTVASTFALGMLMAIIISVLCIIFMGPLLQVLNVSENLYPNAQAYIRVIMSGLVITALYNICAATLRAIGDTITPLIFLIISSFLNIFLDYSFILGLHMGVDGAALATVLSQLISFILCFIYMWKKYPLLRFGKSEMILDKRIVSTMMKSGMSMGLMYSLVNFGTVSLQTTINTFGNETIVAHAAARKITSVCMLPFAMLGQALATYCGQNMGAGQYARIRKGVVQSIILLAAWDAIVVIAAYTISPMLVSAITGSSNQNIVNTGSLYLKVDTVFYFVTTLVCIIRNSLQGIGDTKTPVISSFIELSCKVIIAFTLARAIGYLGIIVAEPISWFLMVIPLMIQFYKNPYMNYKG